MSTWTIFRIGCAPAIVLHIPMQFAKYSPIIRGMLVYEQCEIAIPAGIRLRTEISLRSLRFATACGYRHQRTDGSIPSIIFGRDESGRHGNFHPAAYEKIRANPAWAKRLEKVHTALKRMRPRADWHWKELDCSSSSDALLMNIFCYPDLMANLSARVMFDSAIDCVPEFGFRPRIPLHNGKGDNTEIDMRLDSLLVEAKLTESDFQWASPKLLARYKDLESVFDLCSLPARDGKFGGYQLIRGTLAAHALGCSFCVLCDARRPDLVEAWFRVLRAVRSAELRSRLKLLTWQELALAVPTCLQSFLAAKYGILPAA